MPLLLVVLIAVLVNFSSPLMAQESNTQIRGPRSSDAAPPPLTIGPLSPSDTLWRVAERVRPNANISLYQVMYAIYLKNPEAFLEDNLNHLRPGAVLVLPSQQEMQQVDIAIGRQKSEQDDKVWAARQKTASKKSSTAAVATTQTDNQQAAAASTSKTTPSQWQAELTRVGEQQRQDLDSLRSQFADSMQLVESIAGENVQLKTSLAKVQQELELIKAQLSDDSAIQQQIELLVKQQAELLQANAKEQTAAVQSADWLQWLKHPIAWVLAACIPALLVLFGILLWVKRRSQHTEQVISAAATDPVVDPTYHSPLPPLDTNDLDDSLFEIDDALLEDAFNTPDDLNDAFAATDDLLQLDDTLSFEDDSLLPPESGKAGSAQADQDALDDFDPDNILSDSDLSALLAAADDDDAIELADDDINVPDTAPLPDMVAPPQQDSLSETEDFDIDELIEEIDLDQLTGEDLNVPTLQEQQLAESLLSATVQQEQLTDADNSNVTAVLEPAAENSAAFDSTELDAFAESLAAEHGQTGTVDADEFTDVDQALLSAELAELLDQVTEEPAAVATDNHQTAMHGSDVPDNNIDDALLDDTELEIDERAVAAPDLNALEDESVSRPTEAALSVENPSKMLEQYPELELDEDDLTAELDPELLLSELNGLADDTVEDAQELTELELDPMPEAQFDSLMSELEAMADNLDAAEQEQQQQSAVALTQQLEALQQADNGFDFTDDDFVEIDTLLANASQQEQDVERFNQLNVDVGLDEYADIIGEHEQRDVDIEDNGYSAKLDLVRAYIEMDDSESANVLLDDILSSDVPEHVKTEAQRLRQ